MNVNITSLKTSIEAVIEKHSNELAGKSGQSEDYEDGFIAGLQYVLHYMVPAFETVEIDEATAIENHLQNEIEDIKARHRFGLDESE